MKDTLAGFTQTGRMLVTASVAIFACPFQIADHAVAAADATVAVTNETMTVNQLGPIQNSHAQVVTKDPTYEVNVEGSDTGKVEMTVNNSPKTEVNLSAEKTLRATFTKQGPNIISLRYLPEDVATRPSQLYTVVFDTTGPILQRAEAIVSPLSGATVLVTFAEADLSDANLTNAITIHRQNETGSFADTVSFQLPIVEGRQIRIPVLSLPAGQYKLTLTKDTENNAILTDAVGNPARGVLTTTFSVLPGKTFGEQIEFPRFAPPAKQDIPEEGFNPGDFVETRVARLYYYRDAHRVAQIINRNIRSFNQAAVTQAERRAENSRDGADEATDERRAKERAAVRAAEQARNAEQKLAQSQQQLAEAQQLDNQIANDEAAIGTLDADTDKEKIEELQARVDINKASKTNIGDTDELKQKVASMEQSVAALRETELALREEWNGAQAKEARARARQFRDEVTAAETDPDTYVAGDLKSVDPVAQCSLSVIGEGLIQIRGPIKGINTIRTMINQIDSPVGQIKIGIFSVQVNGEEGDKMEKVVGDAESSIDLSRFLVNQSLNLLRRAIQSEAAMIAEECQLQGHYQVDRDRRYLYAFFGRDFIDELYEMNSEFLFSENKVLSLHAMDTVSLNRALFILALAKNDVRDRVITRFLESAKTELPDAEFDFRRSSELRPHRTQKRFPHWNLTHLPVKNHYHREQVIHEAVHRHALQRYHFRNFSAFFDDGIIHPDTMNPMQREFIRLAQIFKARLIAEMEWKQRVIERGLIEDRANDEDDRYELLRVVHKKSLELERDAYEALVTTAQKNQTTSKRIEKNLAATQNIVRRIDQLKADLQSLEGIYDQLYDPRIPASDDDRIRNMEAFNKKFVETRELLNSTKEEATWATEKDRLLLGQAISAIDLFLTNYNAFLGDSSKFLLAKNQIPKALIALNKPQNGALVILNNRNLAWQRAKELFRSYQSTADSPNSDLTDITAAFLSLEDFLTSDDMATSSASEEVRVDLAQAYDAVYNAQLVDRRIEQAKLISKRTRGDLDQRKLLNHLIDEQEEKFIELVEGTRAHISVMDQYLKRLSIALEDDFKVQFYDPAFVRVREAARGRSVNLSQVERTTILTNNRAFAKVDPQATMEFDLPKRQIAIKEVFDAAKALVEDTGALVNDPTFLSAFQMMGGAKPATTVKNVIPGQSQSTDQHIMGLVPPPTGEQGPGSALQSLVPEPAIYKLETGTGFQIRPVMQPDGDSAVYDFDYMYTTNIREPVRADEKHVGRVKRHFVHTAVQTGNFELREISRYQVALKLSRTSRGVPLLEDIPVLGVAFRPAPSDESSLQQNIIFGQTNIYPTLFDLMGLRWAQQVVDLDHQNLLESEHIIRGRQKSIKDFVFGEASSRVDEFLDLPKTRNYRPDLYHPQTLPSPHHPRGYDYQGGVQDPTGNNFERLDRRPPEMQEPPYDRYRHVPVHPEQIEPLINPPLAPPQGDARNTWGQTHTQLAPPHRNAQLAPARDKAQLAPLHDAPVRASDYWAPAPQTEAQQFQSFISQGPEGNVNEAAQARITDGAAYQQRRAPITGREGSNGGTQESRSSTGQLRVARTAPQLRPRPATPDRRPVARSNSAVIPASYEQRETQSRQPKILRPGSITLGRGQ